MKHIKVTGYYDDTNESHYLVAWQKKSDFDGVAIYGHGGDDTILGVKGTGYDVLDGGEGNDYLDGRVSGGVQGVGDHLFGGWGSDTLVLRAGDTAYGNQGRDMFVIHDGAGEHFSILMDFNLKADQIQFGHTLVQNEDLDQYYRRQTDAGVIVGDSHHETLLLGIYADQLHHL